jgi:putative hemolysin
VLIDGSATIRDVNRTLGIELPDDGDWTTLAGYVLSLSGRMPRTGDKFAVPGGLTLEVVDASQRRVRTLRIMGLPASGARA